MKALRIAAVLSAAALSVGATGASAADSYSPVVSFTTPSLWPVVGGPVPGMGVEGTATDDFAGIARVQVTYCANGAIDAYGGWSCGSGIGLRNYEQIDATVTCTSSTRQSCTWVANAPLQPERYLAFATAWDSAGRVGRTPDPILVIVV